MFNAINKTFCAAALLLGLTACGNADREGAAALLDESRVAIENRDFAKAIELLDTINVRYRDQTEIRRDALVVRAEAMEGIAVDSISAGDQALAEATLKVQSLEGGFKHISSNVGLDGYYLPKDASDKVMTATGIQPRVSEDGHFYIVANIQGRSIGLRAVQFSDGDESVESSSISPSRVLKVEGSEIASFTPEDLEGVGPWLESHDGASKCVLLGSKSKIDVKITSQLRKQLVACVAYSSALQAKRLALVHREKYERMLAAARDQLANLQPVPTDNE